MSAISIAINRFGIGARSDQPTPTDPSKWLLDQIARYDARPDAIVNAPTSAAVAADLADYARQQRTLRQQAMVTPPPLLPAAPMG